ncbi:MAG TPA: ABC transporter ATP-binding protein [Actinomycetota bacterium]|nr:ABC transporter ATP-binding protein [Actinomycetota bacterium]
MSKTRAVHIDGLTKSYGDLEALRNVSLVVDGGHQVALLGLNGSGKTTLLRIAAGLLEPTKGQVVLAGHAAGSLGARAAVSYIPDNPVLYDDLSLEEHLEYVSRLHGKKDWEPYAAELVTRLDLVKRIDDLPSTFSRGLRQKVSIALAFVRPFEVLLVDEPFVGLDQPGQETLLELLGEAAGNGAAVIVSTHQVEYLGQASRCIGLRDGKLMYDGKPTDRAEQEILR